MMLLVHFYQIVLCLNISNIVSFRSHITIVITPLLIRHIQVIRVWLVLCSVLPLEDIQHQLVVPWQRCTTHTHLHHPSIPPTTLRIINCLNRYNSRKIV